MNKILEAFNASLSSSSLETHPEEQARIAPLSEQAWTDEQKNLFGFLQSVDSDAKKPLNMLRTIANHPALLDAFVPMASQLGATTSLPRRDVELLALRTAWRAESKYEWAHHFEYGLAEGLSEIQMASILQEIPTGDWSETECLLMRTADELVAGSRVQVETLQQLKATFSDAIVIEIIFIVNQYNGLSKLANSLAVQLEAGY